MNRVTIRTKKKCKGTMLSVFLEYNPVFINPKGEEVRNDYPHLGDTLPYILCPNVGL